MLKQKGQESILALFFLFAWLMHFDRGFPWDLFYPRGFLGLPFPRGLFFHKAILLLSAASIPKKRPNSRRSVMILEKMIL